MLDQLNIETMLANRVAVGPGLPSPAVPVGPFADALMYPLPTDALIHNSDQKAFFADEDSTSEALLRRIRRDAEARDARSSISTKVVRATLERHKKAGAVAEKFEMAYLRSLDDRRSRRSRTPTKFTRPGNGDYKRATGLHFPFHRHRMRTPRHGRAFPRRARAAADISTSADRNPMLLEPLFNDPALRKTNFVMLHGGWPFAREVTALLTKPNAYLDFSEQTFMNYPRDVPQAIRAWLEYVPEKVLFATDAYPFAPPETGGRKPATSQIRPAAKRSGIALTGMLRDNEITRDRAIELARMVLRDNARKLYGLEVDASPPSRSAPARSAT